MSLSAAELGQIAAELAPRLRGSPVGKIFARDADTLVVEFGCRVDLLLSAAPRASRLHPELVKSRTGEAPPAFAMLLRKRLGGLRLQELHASAGERVITLDFGAGRDRLVAELSGPHANLFLVDGTGLVVAALRRSQSTTRALSVGATYQPPPPAPPGASWSEARRFGESPGVAERVAAHYETKLAATEEHELRERAAAALRREIAKVERREHALLGDLSRADDASRLRKHADLLLAHAHGLPGRGATSATVPDDFEDGSPLTIVLDPMLDARANAAALYRKSKRLTTGRHHAEQRLAAARAEKGALLLRLEKVATAELDTLRVQAPVVKAKRRRDPEVRLPYREMVSADGHAIWVGRSAADNDTLTFRHARGADLWLHCRDAPGSHVVVPLRGGAPATEATIVDAATLAANYSTLRGEAQVDVLVTHVKDVRKVKGAPGKVYTSETRTVRVRLEPERIARLLSSSDRD